MRTLCAVVVALLVATAGEAFANQAKFAGLLRKYAVDIDSVPTLAASAAKAKTACICQDPALRNELGFLISQLEPSTGRFKGGCYVPMFDSGALQTVFSCQSFLPVGK
jgi:hypothetical protein